MWTITSRSKYRRVPGALAAHALASWGSFLAPLGIVFRAPPRHDLRRVGPHPVVALDAHALHPNDRDDVAGELGVPTSW